MTEAPSWLDPSTPIRVGISSCLLGKKVRFDGGHKQDSSLVHTFGRWVEWVPVCPELEVGMGVPREAVRLVEQAGQIRMIAPRSGTDWTEPMRELSSGRVEALAEAGLDGFVLKKDSPSCGMERVKIYRDAGMPTKTGVGLFAAALLARLPSLPVEEEGRLNDPRLRDNFVERVFAHHRLRRLFGGRWRIGDLVRFHTAHKLQLLAHSPAAYQNLGRLVAATKGMSRDQVRETYAREFMAGLKVIATPRRNANVLLHILGYFKKLLDAEDRAELLGLIQDYRAGLVPLVVPVTLLRHWVRVHRVEYLAGQTYLEPHPKELMLRNHV